MKPTRSLLTAKLCLKTTALVIGAPIIMSLAGAATLRRVDRCCGVLGMA
jgi:hypothetical protein